MQHLPSPNPKSIFTHIQHTPLSTNIKLCSSRKPTNQPTAQAQAQKTHIHPSSPKKSRLNKKHQHIHPPSYHRKKNHAQKEPFPKRKEKKPFFPFPFPKVVPFFTNPQSRSPSQPKTAISFPDADKEGGGVRGA